MRNISGFDSRKSFVRQYNLLWSKIKTSENLKSINNNKKICPKQNKKQDPTKKRKRFNETIFYINFFQQNAHLFNLIFAFISA
jgi:hypothetical protein